MAHILGFASFKGGTGKTTLAYAIAERGNSGGLRTLLLDFDPQETACGIAYLREQAGWEVRRGQVSVTGAEELGRVDIQMFQPLQKDHESGRRGQGQG